MSWSEARLKPDHHPSEVYDYLDGWSGSYHHFWDEPWWEDAYVVRVLSPLRDLEKCEAVDHVVRWNEEPDEELYGEDWPAVQMFFTAASALAPTDTFTQRKLVHCFLNTQALSWGDEIRFHLSEARSRITLMIRWKLYLRRRWERECGAPVKETA